MPAKKLTAAQRIASARNASRKWKASPAGVKWLANRAAEMKAARRRYEVKRKPPRSETQNERPTEPFAQAAGSPVEWLKRNCRLPVETFRVSIDDGFVEYSYDMEVGDGSIDGLADIIAKALNCKKPNAVRRYSENDKLRNAANE